MGAFSRSWEITKLSLDVIKADKELLLFPLFAGIFSIVFMVAMIFPTLLVGLVTSGEKPVAGPFAYAIIFLVYLGLALISTFFNVCVVYTTKTRFEGGNATFFESIGFAFSKIHLIVLWSLVSATVGLILSAIDRFAEKSGRGGELLLKIIRGIFGMLWSIATIFVIPVLVYDGLGPIDAIKESVQTLKKTWGESLIRYYGLGFAQFMLFIIGIVCSIILFILALAVTPLALFVVVPLIVLYFLAVILFFSVANGIFNTALYAYASKGKLPRGYSKEILKDAFKHS